MKIYLISGKAQHGKDTFGSYLKQEYIKRGRKVCIMHFSSYLKYYAEKYFGWDSIKEEKPRELLQKLGQEIIRDKCDKPLFLIDRTCEDINILSNFYDIFIITDTRLPLEIEKMKSLFPHVISIHIIRPNFENGELSDEENKHITETALESYVNFDEVIINKTLDEMMKDSERIVRKEESSNEKNDEC